MYLQKVPSSREELMGLNTEKYAFDKAVNSSFVYESPLGHGLSFVLYVNGSFHPRKDRATHIAYIDFFVSIASRKKRNVTEIVKNISKKGD